MQECTKLSANNSSGLFMYDEPCPSEVYEDFPLEVRSPSFPHFIRYFYKGGLYPHEKDHIHCRIHVVFNCLMCVKLCYGSY